MCVIIHGGSLVLGRIVAHFFVFENNERNIQISMTEQEKIDFEKAIRQKVLMEQRAYKKEWRAKNKDKVKESNRKYYEKKKSPQEVDN